LKKIYPAWENTVTPWYPEYDMNIGNPVGKRTSIGMCWIRKYEN